MILSPLLLPPWNVMPPLGNGSPALESTVKTSAPARPLIVRLDSEENSGDQITVPFKVTSTLLPLRLTSQLSLPDVPCSVGLALLSVVSTTSLPSPPL